MFSFLGQISSICLPGLSTILISVEIVEGALTVYEILNNIHN